MSRDGWRAVAVVAFLATAWLWLVPYASSGEAGLGAPVNCGSPLLSDAESGDKAAAGCRATSDVRLQQGFITLLFAAGVLVRLAVLARRSPEEPQPAQKSVSWYD